MPPTSARPAARPRRTGGAFSVRGWPTVLGVALTAVGITALVWRTGVDGSPNGLVHLYYLPIVYLAAFVGRGAAATMGVLAGLAAGPLMPVAGVIDLARPDGQPVGEWAVRMALLVVVGVVVAWFARQQPRPPELVLRDRAFARALRGAVASGHVTAHFQPIVDLADGHVLGAEALCRWTDASGRSIPPSEFIPLAERTGVIDVVGRRVLDLAIRQAEQWVTCDPAPSVAINVSAAQLSDPAFPVELAAVLAASSVDPRRLCLEITETAIIADPQAALGTVTAARETGLSIALDDFGTGQSSLAYLAEFPIDIVKIDKAFVDEVDRDDRTRDLVRAIVDMAEAIGATTIAEGIERPAQLAALRALGCRFGQGYLLGRPTAADEVDLSPRRFARQVPSQRGAERCGRSTCASRPPTARNGPATAGRRRRGPGRRPWPGTSACRPVAAPKPGPRPPGARSRRSSR